MNDDVMVEQVMTVSEENFGGDAGDLSDDLWGEGYGAKGLAADLLDFEDYDPYIKSLNVDMEREVTKR